eukprot:263518-Ditylum_brightwellii.AAC.1
MASLALAKRPFPAQLIVAFVLSVIVVLVVDVITAVLVAAAMASLALAKRLFAAARHYIPFCLFV